MILDIHHNHQGRSIILPDTIIHALGDALSFDGSLVNGALVLRPIKNNPYIIDNDTLDEDEALWESACIADGLEDEDWSDVNWTPEDIARAKVIS